LEGTLFATTSDALLPELATERAERAALGVEVNAYIEIYADAERREKVPQQEGFRGK
jgi:hypothetical protein